MTCGLCYKYRYTAETDTRILKKLPLSLGPHLLHLAPDAGDQTQGYESVCVETAGCSHSRPHVQCQGSRLKTQTINCNPSYYLHVSLPLLVTMPTASYYNNELKNIY